MKILHMMLSNFYVDNYNYQENIFPRQNKADGNEILIIASTETYLNDNYLEHVLPSEYLNDDGIMVKRLNYRNFPIKLLKYKIRSYVGVIKAIEDFNPDIILFHGTCGLEIINVAMYKKKNQNVKFYVDSHEDFNNSAKNFLSKNILHKIIYNYSLNKALPYIDKIFYVNYEAKIFLQKMYNIPESILEYLPLGGNIIKDELRRKKRETIRSILNLSPTDLLLFHSGKMCKAKRTIDIIKAFSATNANNLVFVFVGSMTDDVKYEVLPLVNKDSRIHYLGWKSAEELQDYLCASDLYVQPGGQSVTMQNALCCGSAAALYPHESHKYLLGDSVFYVETVEDMKDLFEQIAQDPSILEKKRNMSFELAKEKLDYKQLAARLYE